MLRTLTSRRVLLLFLLGGLTLWFFFAFRSGPETNQSLIPNSAPIPPQPGSSFDPPENPPSFRPPDPTENPSLKPDINPSVSSPVPTDQLTKTVTVNVMGIPTNISIWVKNGSVVHIPGCMDFHDWRGRSIRWWNADCSPFLCDRHSRVCDNDNLTIHDYIDLKKAGLKMNRPAPCCTAVLKEMLRIWYETVPEGQHFAFFGSLLGAVRDGRIMSWTADNDMLAEHKFATDIVNRTSPLWKQLYDKGLSILDDLGFYRMCINYKYLNNTLYKLWPSPHKPHCLAKMLYSQYFPAGDIFTFTESDGHIHGVGQFKCRLPTHYFYPVQKLYLTGYGDPELKDVPINFTLKPEDRTQVWVWAPKNATYLLEYVYGKTWTTPDKTRNSHGNPTCHKINKAPPLPPKPTNPSTKRTAKDLSDPIEAIDSATAKEPSGLLEDPVEAIQ